MSHKRGTLAKSNLIPHDMARHRTAEVYTLEVISKVVRIKEPGVRIIGKRTEFELEFHSEFWILSSEFPQNTSFAIGSIIKKME